MKTGYTSPWSANISILNDLFEYKLIRFQHVHQLENGAIFCFPQSIQNNITYQHAEHSEQKSTYGSWIKK
jgi:hypothetical protein